MLKKLEVNIHKNALFSKNDKLLLAFSGGVDSVVLADLLYKAGYQFNLAHCNFKLRGTEADNDTEFCEHYANTIGSKCHVTYFDTKEYAQQNKLSIQMAARELRYNWFNELIKEHGYSCILTAHHANDNIETVFVNLVRGTGIKGLQGIPEKQHAIVRPLLFATKEEIKQHATKHELKYREDSSNVEIKYKRNFIRHQIIPELKKLNPALEETFATSIQFFKQSAEIVSMFSSDKFKVICKEENHQLHININLLLQEPQKETLLFEWLYKKNFKTTQIQQLTEVLISDKQVGKLFSSSTHQLVVDRSHIIVQALNDTHQTESFTINSFSDTDHLPIKLVFEETTSKEFSKDKNEIIIAYSDHLFPLTLRKWKQGDKFKPLGMNGFKKLSDFFKDQKFSKFDKEAAWILENKEHIIWIMGHRMDDRCKVLDGTERVIKIKI
ncbi:MAG: tRNA lysidine(34) synthetase TilS [Bacteroidota bacterium]